MSSTVVINWTDHQVLSLVASQGVSGTSIREEANLRLPDAATPAVVAKALRPHIAGHVGSKPTVVVLVGGGDVQYRLLDLPPAPRDDLVDMVRMQAESHFASSDDGSLIDFAQLAGSDQLPCQVLLARLASRAVRDINETMGLLGITPTHIVPVGVAAAWYASVPGSLLANGNHLLVVPAHRSLDLAVVHDGKLTLGRRVGFASAEDMATVAKLQTPIRRTLAAAAGELPGESFASICWLGDLDESLERALATAVGMPVESLDVVSLARSAGDINAGSLELSAFAAHLGALAQLPESDFALDFLHPKQRSIPPSQRRLWALAATAAVVTVACGAWMMYSRVANLNAEADAIYDERSTLLAQVEQIAPQVTRADAIEQWLATDINWLDELALLSEKIRPLKLTAEEFDEAADVRVEQLTLKRKAGSTAVGGDIDLAAAAREMATIETLEARIRDERHSVVPSAVNTDADKAPYEWTFKVQVGVPPVTQEGA